MKYDQVIRAGMCGSGNTLIRLILDYLLDESKVIGTHRYLDNLEIPTSLISDNIGIVIPCRDFRSVIASTMRKTRQSVSRSNIIAIYKNFFTPQYVALDKFRTKYPRQEDILWLMYNRFFHNYDYIVDKLQDFLFIDVTQEQRDQIKKSFSLRANKNRITELKLKNWENVDTHTKLHGNHIGTGAIESWKTFFKPELHEFVTELMLTELTTYGYERKA